MIKKTIKIAMVGIADYQYNTIINILKNEFDIIIDKINPEYIIVGPFYIYYDDSEIKYFYEKYKNTINIFYGDEAYLPDFNFFDYAVGFDDIKFNDRYIRMTPLNYAMPYLDNKSLTLKEIKELLYKKKYFCNFIYSHGNGIPERDLIFEEISRYKFVHALGRHKKNCDIEIGPRNVDFMQGSIEAKKLFKLSIAVENNYYRDGVTEKIVTSMAANTIPIYFGDYNIGERFNTKSFINVHEYANISDMVKRVKEIDENDELWSEIMLEPWQTNDQKQKVMEEISKSPDEFIKNIFKQDIKDAKRKGHGLFIDTYRNANVKIFNNNLSYLKIKKSITKIINTIAWWIPIKKWRDSFKKILNKKFIL